MRILRWVTGLLLLPGLSCAPPAQADEWGYLYAIHSAGMTLLGDIRMLRIGEAVCADFADGSTVLEIGAALTGPGSPFTVLQAGQIIYASVDQLCPAFKRRAEAEVGGTGTLV